MSALSRLLFTSAAVFAALVPNAVLAQTVVIDPGHGGSDPGAVGCGLKEEDVNLDVSLRAATILRASGLTVHLTRTDDRFVELAARSSFANARGATRFVSVHSNANAGTPATGTETFVYTSPSATSRSLGQGVQNELISTWRLSNRGLKTANFSVLRRTSMPAALAELGFINRCSPDAALLGNAAERGRIATALARAILASVGRSGPTSPPPDVTPPPTSGTGRLLGVAFEDVGVGFEDTTRRLTGAAVRIRGTRSFDGTTSDTGAFAFDAPVGDYSIEVSKSGFTTATRECTVTATDTWCSIGLTRVSTPTAPTTTNVRGVIYEDTGAGLTDSATRLAGATVTIGGASATTDATGGYAMEVTPGAVSIRVSHDGYETITRSCDAVGAETWCSIGLVPTESAGRLQGVVYADGDLTRRVADATLTVLETGVTTRSGAENGYWRFDLAAGVYTVRAEAAGYSPQTRACTVEEGGETWCSLGLSRSGSGGSVVVDERPIEDAATDPYDDVTTLSSNGCSAGGGSSSMGWLLLLLGVVAWRRRGESSHDVCDEAKARSAARRGVVPTLLGCMLLLGTTLLGCSGEEVRGSTEALVQEALVESDELELADEVASFAQLNSVRELTSGDYIDLELSPTGDHLALSHATHNGLSLVEVVSGETRVLRESPQAGYEPLWRADGLAIGVRTPGQTSTAAPMLAFALDGAETAPIGGEVTLRVRIDDAGGVVIRHQGGAESRIAPPGDQYFEPRASANGEFVVFRGLSTGLYVHRVADGATFMVGAGSHARFDPQSRYLVFERLVEEDGHEVTGSTLHLLDLRHPRLRHGPIAVEVPFARAPSLAGSTLAFMGESNVAVGVLTVQ